MTRRAKTAGSTTSATTKTTGSRARKPKESEPKKVVQVSINEVLPTKLRLKCRNAKQKEFINLINDKEIVIASGPAGVGKSYVAIAKAIELLQDDSSKYTTLVICKPAVESGENLGFLPGDLKEKLAPFLASSIDIVDKLVGESARVNMEEGRILKIEALGMMRGKTIDNTILIMEEAQNTTPHQMKTLLTRIGENSKFVISGDLDQSDLFNDPTKSGLYDIVNKHKNIQEIGFFEFNEDDIVRNPLITKILKNYKNEPKKEKVLMLEKKKPLVDPLTGQVDLKYDQTLTPQDIYIAQRKNDTERVRQFISPGISTREKDINVSPNFKAKKMEPLDEKDKEGWIARNFKW